MNIKERVRRYYACRYYICVSFLIMAAPVAVLTGCGEHQHAVHDGHDEHEGHDGHDEHEGEHADEHDGEKGDDGRIVLSHEAEENAAIKTEVVEPGAFHNVIRAGGVIENTPTAERVISAPASGMVRFASNLVTGSDVRRGAVICTISSAGMEPGEGVASARAALAAARKQLEQGEELYKSNLITKREYEKLKGDVATAEAALSGVSTRSATTGVAVTAPITGYLVRVNVRSGEYVNAGDPIAVISQSKNLMLRADVSERHAASVQDIVGANIVTSSGQAVSLAGLQPRVVSGGVSDPAQGYYIPVYIEFNNPGGLYSGTNVQVFLLGGERTGVISVPKSAVVEEAGVFSVYVETGHCTYERREIKQGMNDGQRVEVLSGLKPGDKVVTNGAMSVRMAGMGSKIQGHTHNH
ncbi:MAG: efflux RND transporter periplasmic adaptor subunit [Muribaculaceae bacterium]|nr:efflux RND transporter periplasmic adaptor subunit [Muribaculaceae bacterium]